MCASPARDYSYEPQVVHDVVLTGLVRDCLPPSTPPYHKMLQTRRLT